MTNTNVDFNLVCQQLRKFKTSLIYNVIEEMFIDSQLRALTDIFIKAEDMAFDLDALIAKKPLGADFRWKIYPMSGYVAGREAIYSRTHQTLPSTRFHFTPWRGIYDSSKYQRQGRYSISTKEKLQMMEGRLSMESSPETVEYIDRWSWLEPQIIKLRRSRGDEYIKDAELWDYLGLRERNASPLAVGKFLPSLGIVRSHNTTGGHTMYYIKAATSLENEKKKEVLTA